MRKKKLLYAFMIMVGAISMTACSLPIRPMEMVQQTEEEDIIEEPEEEDDSDYVYDSSSEVIEAYWKAFSDLSLSEFESVFENGCRRAI